MPAKSYLGEFEQMLLLAILQRADDATGLKIRRELAESADRAVSKGAFYTTLDRLERKGYVGWEVRGAGGSDSSLPQRHFSVTPEGLAELRKSRTALERLWRGLDGLLEGA
jgi:DNA-binding PadR family transcriptional regulator